MLQHNALDAADGEIALHHACVVGHHDAEGSRDRPPDEEREREREIEVEPCRKP